MNIVSEKDGFTFIRKNFIKDLFNAKDIFNKFRIIEFKNTQAFFNYIKYNFWNVGNQYEYVVNVSTKEDIDNIISVLRATGINNQVAITVKYGQNLIEDILAIDPTMVLYYSSNYDVVKQLVNRESQLLDSRLHWTEYTFTAQNYAEEYEKLIKLCLADPRFVWIDLQFDWQSFEEMQVKDFHKLYFYMNQFRIWKDREPIVDGQNSQKITLKNRDSSLKCFVDENLDIYLNRDEIYFPMSQFIGKNGEELNIHDLNKIRKIVDIKFIDPGFENLYLVNLDDNYKIMGDHYRIPYITSMVGRWLNV